MVMSPSLMVGLVLSLPIISSLDFSWPNLILYLLAVLFVIDSRVCWSSMLLVMIATSSTHRRHVELVSILVWVVHLVFGAFFISLLISSISVAYWVTASTPPCLMLLLIFMGFVMPCLVLMVAVRFWLRRSVRSHVAPSHPCLFITYMMASIHALSYAFVTSRNVM